MPAGRRRESRPCRRATVAIWAGAVCSCASTQQAAAAESWTCRCRFVGSRRARAVQAPSASPHLAGGVRGDCPRRQLGLRRRLHLAPAGRPHSGVDHCDGHGDLRGRPGAASASVNRAAGPALGGHRDLRRMDSAARRAGRHRLHSGRSCAVVYRRGAWARERGAGRWTRWRGRGASAEGGGSFRSCSSVSSSFLFFVRSTTTSFLHHPPHALDDRVDAGRRVALDRHEIGEIAGATRPSCLSISSSAAGIVVALASACAGVIPP